MGNGTSMKESRVTKGTELKGRIKLDFFRRKVTEVLEGKWNN